MTQSGLSQHIKKIESQLNVSLILRHGKSFELTPAGKRLYQEASKILDDLSALPSKVEEDEPFRGIVRVMSPGSVGLALYPELLTLQQRYPRLIIDYRFAPNREIEKAIKDKRCDIGLTSGAFDTHALHHEKITEEPLLLITPEAVKQPDWEDLMALGFIHHPDGEHHGKQLLSANFSEFQTVDQFPVSGFSNQIGLILEPVSLGLGFTVLPAHAVEAFSKPETLCLHFLKVSISESLYLCRPRHQPQTKAVVTVINEIKQRLC